MITQIFKTLLEYFKDQKFEVRSAANYDQAVFEINKKLPDLAIIDIMEDDSKVGLIF